MLSCNKVKQTANDVKVEAPQLRICPACSVAVYDTIEDPAVRTQKQWWHPECFKRFIVETPDPASFCPWCKGGFDERERVYLSKHNRRWHFECWLRQKESHHLSAEMNLYKRGFCPGCRRQVPPLREFSQAETLTWHLSNGGRWWCDECWSRRILTKSFQVGTVPREKAPPQHPPPHPHPMTWKAPGPRPRPFMPPPPPPPERANPKNLGLTCKAKGCSPEHWPG